MLSDLHLLAGQQPGKSVWLPGWATDWRLFSLFDPPDGVLSPTGFLPSRYHDTLIRHLQDLPAGSVTLAGWSLGAYEAIRTARAVPQSIDRLVLAGARPSYPCSDLRPLQHALQNNTRKSLRRFYRQCFLPAQRDEFALFREELLDKYLEDMSRNRLVKGLNYLHEQRLTPDDLPECDIIFVHGENDIVAPAEEIRTLCDQLNRVRLLMVPSAGHAVFATAPFRNLCTPS
ncbi:MAG: alpha/beta fold hydrolase [Planctomycetota bacterium]